MYVVSDQGQVTLSVSAAGQALIIYIHSNNCQSCSMGRVVIRIVGKPGTAESGRRIPADGSVRTRTTGTLRPYAPRDAVRDKSWA